MPLQNRVNPRGEILLSSSRGLLMGNRGCLHNAHKEVVRPSKIIHWVTCSLQFKGIVRELMKEGSYTELFFLDEATALAAGHRPCYTCRKERYRTFKTIWGTTQGMGGGVDRAVMDATLHKERLSPEGRKVKHTASLDGLPDGTFIEIEDACFLVWREKILAWSFEGYIEARTRPVGIDVSVLTPASIVKCLTAGYVPELHPTAGQHLG